MIITSHFISLDGVIGSPEQWHGEFVSPKQYEVLREQLNRTDGLLIGRRTYEEFAAYWPHQGDDVPIAPETNAMRKYVVSRTGGTSWGPAQVLAPDPIAAAHEVSRLGLTVWATGGHVPRTLLAAGLVDELQLYLDPIVLGAGMKLFEGRLWQSRFSLTSSRELPNGVQHLTYRVA